jgi:hypothetical protein
VFFKVLRYEDVLKQAMGCVGQCFPKLAEKIDQGLALLHLVLCFSREKNESPPLNNPLTTREIVRKKNATSETAAERSCSIRRMSIL